MSLACGPVGRTLEPSHPIPPQDVPSVRRLARRRETPRLRDARLEQLRRKKSPSRPRWYRSSGLRFPAIVLVAGHDRNMRLVIAPPLRSSGRLCDGSSVQSSTDPWAFIGLRSHLIMQIGAQTLHIGVGGRLCLGGGGWVGGHHRRHVEALRRYTE